MECSDSRFATNTRTSKKREEKKKNFEDRKNKNREEGGIVHG